jgi:hypothetical protein
MVLRGHRAGALRCHGGDRRARGHRGAGPGAGAHQRGGQREREGVVGGAPDHREGEPAHRLDGAWHAGQAGEQVEHVAAQQPPGDQQRDAAQHGREDVLDRAVEQPRRQAVPGDSQLRDAAEPAEHHHGGDLEDEQEQERSRSSQNGGSAGRDHRLACLRAPEDLDNVYKRVMSVDYR